LRVAVLDDHPAASATVESAHGPELPTHIEAALPVAA
jgi:hypothetical protein